MGDAFKKTLDGMTAEDAAGLLRTLATLLEESGTKGAGSPFLPLDMELGDFAKLKLSLKRDDDGFAVKMKIQLPDAPLRPSPLDYLDRHPDDHLADNQADAVSATAPEVTGTDGNPEAGAKKEGYKTLKKRMKKSFGGIRDALRIGALPAADLVNAFLTDSRRMTGFRGYGDEYYDAYDRARDRFREAWDAADVPACQSAAQELERLKKDCHDRYK